MLLCGTNLRHAMINDYQISCVLNMTTKLFEYLCIFVDMSIFSCVAFDIPCY